MDIVRFIRKDNKPNEDYYYHEEIQAKKHFESFKDDNSGLYSRIELLREFKSGNGSYIIDVIAFDIPFKNGDLVKLVRKWSRPAERKYIYVVANVNELTQRCDIRAVNSNMILVGTETVSFEMIEKIEKEE